MLLRVVTILLLVAATPLGAFARASCCKVSAPCCNVPAAPDGGESHGCPVGDAAPESGGDCAIGCAPMGSAIAPVEPLRLVPAEATALPPAAEIGCASRPAAPSPPTVSPPRLPLYLVLHSLLI